MPHHVGEVGGGVVSPAAPECLCVLDTDLAEPVGKSGADYRLVELLIGHWVGGHRPLEDRSQDLRGFVKRQGLRTGDGIGLARMGLRFDENSGREVGDIA